MKNEKLIMGIFAFLLLFGGTIFSQEIVTDEDALFGSDDESIISTDEDDLFGTSGDSEDEMFDTGVLIEETEEDQMIDLSSVLLTSDDGVEIGGNFFFDVTSSWTGFDPGDMSGSIISENSVVDLGAEIYLDARPDKDSRVFAKAMIRPPLSDSNQKEFEDIVSNIELFADFNWHNNVFFRAGKQTVNWGVGYFFSPADLLSLSRIDPENPDEELDGPVAIKANYPSLLNNYYIYAVIPGTINSLSDIAVAPLMEFVAGSSEITLGAYYQYGKAPAAMTALTSGIGDVSIFGEGYLSYGSDKTFVGDGGFTTITYDDTFFFKGTVGASYAWSDDLSNFNFSFSGQYFFNGEGYEDQDLLQSPAVFSLHPSDLIETGRHYGAASASWREMLGSDFTLSLFFIENFSSFSGMIKPAISWSGLDNIDVSLSATWMFGETGEEYSPMGETASISLGVSIGGTSF